MFRGLVLSGLVISLSALGMLAGRGVTPSQAEGLFSRPLVVKQLDQTDSIQAYSTPLDGTVAHFPGPVDPPPEFPDVESKRAAETSDFMTPAVNGLSKEEALQLIRKEFPDATEETAEGWAESFTGLSRMEIVGMLQQKKLLSASLDSLLPASLLDSAAAKESIIETGYSRTVEAEEPEKTRNTAETPGYRRQRELNLPGHADGALPAILTDFTPGPLMVTGCGQHAAIVDNSGLVMFRLEQNFATRFGAFEILSDRRIGIRLEGKELPLAGVSVLPEHATTFAIDNSGTVVARSDSGDSTPLGQVGSVRLIDTRAIRTDDNITFDYSAMQAGDYEIVQQAALFAGRLELSNITE